MSKIAQKKRVLRSFLTESIQDFHTNVKGRGLGPAYVKRIVEESMVKYM
jgi:nitrogen fixation/metabolism regulation signal transduction histidine kinase